MVWGRVFLKRVEGSAVDGFEREVAVVTLDDLCAERNLKGPYFIKIDVQGAELRVIAGANRILVETEALVMEVSLLGMIVGAPQLSEVVSYMKDIGFVPYDIFDFLHRPLDGALSQVDMVFVREDGPFRQDHAFATPAQREAMLIKSRLPSVA
jgi:hypothetical protein